MPVGFDVTNQKASPALYASSLATRPAASFVGRLFVDTDTPSTGIYRDTGTVWLSISGGSSETQSLNDVCVIGNTTTTLGILINGQSTVGTHDSSSSSIPPEADFALTIGEDYPATGFSIYTTHKNHFAGVLRNEGTVVFDTLGGTGSRIVVASADGTLTASAALSSYVTGSGTTNYVPKFTSASAIGNSNLINDASGNLGLGVTPSAYGTGTAIDFSVYGTINNFDDGTKGNFQIGYNYYQSNATTFNYKTGDLASMYRQRAGVHSWYTAPSGTAGNAITFTQSMTLFANGNLAINSTTDAGYLLDVNGTGRFSSSITPLTIQTTGGNNGIIMLTASTKTSWLVGAQYNADQSFEITPSTTVGGTTFSTPALTIVSTGAATFSSSVSVGNFTTVQKNALTGVAGMIVYDTTLNKLCVYTTAWETITSI